MYSFLWNSASFRAALNTGRAEAQRHSALSGRIYQLCAGGAVLTVPHQDQGALGLGPAVVDLDGVGPLAGPGEVVHRHLDNSRRCVVADFVSLANIVRHQPKVPSVARPAPSSSLRLSWLLGYHGN